MVSINIVSATIEEIGEERWKHLLFMAIVDTMTERGPEYAKFDTLGFPPEFAKNLEAIWRLNHNNFTTR